MAGYHLTKIEKGTLGDFSKVIEEFMEFEDACAQDCHIMALVELSDLVGSLKHYFKKNGQQNKWDDFISECNNQTVIEIDESDLRENFKFIIDSENQFHWNKIQLFINEVDMYARKYNLNLNDLIKMNDITERAFVSGARQ